MLLLFDILMFSYILICKKRNGSYFTPFIIFVLPYSLIININNLFVAQKYNYYFVSNTSFSFLILIFSLLFFIEMIFIGKKISPHSNVYNIKYSYSIVRLIYLLGLISYVISFILNVKIYGIEGAKGKNDGVFGHLTNVALVFLPIYFIQSINKYRRRISIIKTEILSYKICKKRRKRARRDLYVSMFEILIFFVISFLFGGKYVIFITSLYIMFSALFYFKLSNKTYMKIFVFMASLVFMVFLFLYFLVPLITGSYGSHSTMKTTFDFAIEHMLYYMTSPVIALNYSFTHLGEYSNLLPFTVFINFFKVLTPGQQFVSPILPFVFPYTNGDYVNVSGIIGESFYSLGYFAFIYLCFVFLIFEMIFLQFKMKRQCLFLLSYISSIFVLGFFVNYFTVSGVMYPFIDLIIIESIICYTKVYYGGNKK